MAGRPAAGALLQEGIDLAVILNALRALRIDQAGMHPLSPDAEELVRRFAAEHDQMRDDLSILRDTALQVSAGERAAALPTQARSSSRRTCRAASTPTPGSSPEPRSGPM